MQYKVHPPPAAPPGQELVLPHDGLLEVCRGPAMVPPGGAVHTLALVVTRTRLVNASVRIEISMA